jgi:hypothetical protein
MRSAIAPSEVYRDKKWIYIEVSDRFYELYHGHRNESKAEWRVGYIDEEGAIA